MWFLFVDFWEGLGVLSLLDTPCAALKGGKLWRTREITEMLMVCEQSGKRLLSAMGVNTPIGKAAVRLDMILEQESRSRNPLRARHKKKCLRKSKNKQGKLTPAAMWSRAN